MCIITGYQLMSMACNGVWSGRRVLRVCGGFLGKKLLPEGGHVDIGRAGIRNTAPPLTKCSCTCVFAPFHIPPGSSVSCSYKCTLNVALTLVLIMVRATFNRQQDNKNQYYLKTLCVLLRLLVGNVFIVILHVRNLN